MLHGNLLLAMIDAEPRRARLRRAGVRKVVERALGPTAGLAPRGAP